MNLTIPLAYYLEFSGNSLVKVNQAEYRGVHELKSRECIGQKYGESPGERNLKKCVCGGGRESP
jgi:hypothetical protein